MMGGRYIVPLDFRDYVIDKRLMYLRRGFREKSVGKNLVNYIDGVRKLYR